MADSSSENKCETGNSSVPPVERVRQEVDRWLEVVRTTGERAMETLGLSQNRSGSPAVDVIELPKEIVVQIELPGIPAESVELSLVGNMLTIAAAPPRQETSNEARVHLRERVHGRYQRSIPLPATVNEDAIRAEARDGLLTVTLPKEVPSASRSIPITSGS